MPTSDRGEGWRLAGDAGHDTGGTAAGAIADHGAETSAAHRNGAGGGRAIAEVDGGVVIGGLMLFVMVYLLANATMLLAITCGTLIRMDRQATNLRRQLDVERGRNAAEDLVIARRNHLLGLDADMAPFSAN